jgi:hypothetical protein
MFYTDFFQELKITDPDLAVKAYGKRPTITKSGSWTL